MNLKTYYNRNVNISQAVQKDAEQLVEMMKNNSLILDTLPNTYENYTGRLELNDFLSFCEFLESRQGKKILSLVEDVE